MTTGFLKRTTITNPMNFIISRVYYIRKYTEKKFKKYLCVSVMPQKAIFVYIDYKADLHKLFIWKDELENYDYIIMRVEY